MNSNPSRVFECKTCNRRFSSFQALGGHRASHKKPRLIEGDDRSSKNQPPAKPKTHECPICGLEFAIGQALGGHMSRNRAGSSENKHRDEETAVTSIVKKSNGARVLCLDLNFDSIGE